WILPSTKSGPQRNQLNPISPPRAGFFVPGELAMAYNTGNAVPSRDARDLVDNAENLDSAVNGVALSFQDRLGQSRKSWAGMEQDFADFLAGSGYEPEHLEYQDDVALTVDRPTQLINYGGSVYRVKF